MFIYLYMVLWVCVYLCTVAIRHGYMMPASSFLTWGQKRTVVNLVSPRSCRDSSCSQHPWAIYWRSCSCRCFVQVVRWPGYFNGKHILMGAGGNGQKNRVTRVSAGDFCFLFFLSIFFDSFFSLVGGSAQFLMNREFWPSSKNHFTQKFDLCRFIFNRAPKLNGIINFSPVR